MAEKSGEDQFQSVLELYKKAEKLKIDGNDEFKRKNYRASKKKYHHALLHLRAISSRETVGRSMSFMKSSVPNQLLYDNPPHFKDVVEKLECDCIRNLGMVFLQEENWEKSLKYCTDALAYNENDEKALYRAAVSALNLGILDTCATYTRNLLSINLQSRLYRSLKLSLDDKNE